MQIDSENGCYELDITKIDGTVTTIVIDKNETGLDLLFDEMQEKGLDWHEASLYVLDTDSNKKHLHTYDFFFIRDYCMNKK